LQRTCKGSKSFEEGKWLAAFSERERFSAVNRKESYQLTSIIPRLKAAPIFFICGNEAGLFELSLSKFFSAEPCQAGQAATNTKKVAVSGQYSS